MVNERINDKKKKQPKTHSARRNNNKKWWQGILMIRQIYTDWPQGHKTFFSCSIQLSMKFILLINIKMPTSVR